MSSFAVWNASGTAILLDADGSEIWLEEAEARVAIGRQQIGVLRPNRKSRAGMKLFLRPAHEANVALNGKKDRYPDLTKKLERFRQALPVAEPTCILTPLSEGHVYTHHARRCQGFYDGRNAAFPCYIDPQFL